VTQLNEHGIYLVGDKRKEKYNGFDIETEVKEIIRHPSGYIVVREHITGKKEDMERIRRNEKIVPKIIVPHETISEEEKKKWFQFWK
jgi:hypothetical protein